MNRTFPDILRGSVWHTTTPERYQSIIESGRLLPDPNLSDSERWGTAMGETHYPYVRSIGGVSLFDFRGFDEEKYSKSYPVSTWREFVPCSHRSNAAIWVEIDLSLIEEKFISGKILLEKWKTSGELRRKIMPMIEAAHIGPMSTSVFKRVLMFDNDKREFYSYEGSENKYA